ncbi:MAG: helix-turn-helix transcriptional regulator [Bacteroidales bacterium]
MECKQIRERIRRARRVKGYTQEYMAESLGISTNSYREIESGKTTLINPRLCKIAELLGLPMESLIFERVTKEEYLDKIKNLEKEQRVKIKNLTSKYKIGLFEKDEQITVLKAKLETKEKIIGVLNDNDAEY